MSSLSHIEIAALGSAYGVSARTDGSLVSRDSIRVRAFANMWTRSGRIGTVRVSSWIRYSAPGSIVGSASAVVLALLASGQGGLAVQIPGRVDVLLGPDYVVAERPGFGGVGGLGESCCYGFQAG